MADRSRAAMLQAMLGGEALAAGELARVAGVAAPTASAHLSRLVDGGLVACLPQGRHRYYRLADPRVAEVLESLALLARETPVRSLRESEAARSLSLARTCYDHLAGRLGVALADRLLQRSWLAEIDGQWVLTPQGRRCLAEWGLDPPSLLGGRRAFIRQCLDWTERRPHLAGALGAAITGRCFELGWVRRVRGSRAVRPTPGGRVGLAQTFGIGPGFWEGRAEKG